MLTSNVVPPSDTPHVFEVIQRSAELQARLIDDLLDTSRIITGKFHMEPASIEVAPILQAAVEVIRPSADAKRISLRVVTDNQNSAIQGDANRLQQIFWNLLSNAVKFTAEGGHIEVELREIRDRVEIAVTDSGAGIEPNFLPHVFDRFRQADNTSTRRYGGLGLGLAIVRHLAEVHGGSVSASSRGIGKGSTFTVYFPATRSTQAGPESLPMETTSRQFPEGMSLVKNDQLMGVRVLVVEDDSDTLAMLQFILDRGQATVTTASSVVDALRALQQSPHDVLISDLAMPAQDGYDLIQHIRSLPPERGGDIPAVALSAFTRSVDRRRALAAGFQLYISKPVDPGELVAALARITGRQDRNAA